MNERGYAVTLYARRPTGAVLAGPIDFTPARELGLDSALLGAHVDGGWTIMLGYDGDLVPRAPDSERAVFLDLVEETLMRLTRAGVIPHAMWQPVAVIWHDGDIDSPRSPRDVAVDDQVMAALNEAWNQED